jgi:hypothetical protein
LRSVRRGELMLIAAALTERIIIIVIIKFFFIYVQTSQPDVNYKVSTRNEYEKINKQINTKTR